MKKNGIKLLALLCALALCAGLVPAGAVNLYTDRPVAQAAPAQTAPSRSARSDRDADEAAGLSASHTLWLVGDSTVCNYTSNDDKTYARVRNGYGMQLSKFMDDTFALRNLAISGTSSKNFVSQSNYTTLFGSSGIKSGDVLVIGFGHNDQKAEDARYTNPNGDYQTSGSFANSLFKNYIEKAVAKGATVIVCTPIVRRSAGGNYDGSSGHIPGDGKNDNNEVILDGSGNPKYPGGDYPAAIRTMVTTLKGNSTYQDSVYLVDLTALTKAHYLAVGADANEKYHAYSTKIDNTHLNAYGAQVVAQMLAKGIKELSVADLSGHFDDTKFTPTESAITSGSSYSGSGETPSTGSYTAPTTGNSSFPKYTVGGVTFEPAVFGAKAKPANTTMKTDANGDMYIKVTNAGGSIGSTADSIAMYWYKVPVGSKASLSATATLNSALGLGDKDASQCCFGLMARDDMYVSDTSAEHLSNYVVAGSRGAGVKTDGTAFASVNCFYRKDGTLTNGPALTTELAVGTPYKLSITPNGEEDGFAVKFGDEAAQTAGYDFDINAVDKDYYYIGMFASREAEVTFSDIRLVVDGVTLCAPADETGTKYAITVQAGEHGTGRASLNEAVENKTVTLTATPDAGYYLDHWEAVSPSNLTINGNTFVMPAAAVTVKPVFVYDPELDNSPVDYAPNLTVDPKGSGALNFKTVRQAVAYAARMTRTDSQRVTVTIAPGTYREQIIITAPNLTFKNANPAKEVKLTWYYGIGYLYYSAKDGFYDRTAAAAKTEKGGVDKWGTSVYLKNANGFLAENITFENSFNYYVTQEELADGVYAPGDKQVYSDTSISYDRTAANADVRRKGKNSSDASNATERAAALVIEAENCEFYRCKFLSSQDTLYTAGKGYFKECFIEGQTDYIFGKGEVIFDECTLSWKGYSANANGGHITAKRPRTDGVAETAGYLFRNCTVQANKNGLSVAAGTFGRPWRAGCSVIFLNTIVEKTGLISDAGWGEMNGVSASGANFREYNSKYASGSKVDTSKRSDKSNTVLSSAPTIDMTDYFGAWEPIHFGEVTSVTVTGPSGITSTRRNVGSAGSIQLSAAVAPEDAKVKTVTWTSSDQSGKVSVSATGLVSIAADAVAGTYTITAASDQPGSAVKGTYPVVLLPEGAPLDPPMVHIFDAANSAAAVAAARSAGATVTTGATPSTTGFFTATGGSSTAISGLNSADTPFILKGTSLMTAVKLTKDERTVSFKTPGAGKLLLYFYNQGTAAGRVDVNSGAVTVSVPAGCHVETITTAATATTYKLTAEKNSIANAVPFLYAAVWLPDAQPAHTHSYSCWRQAENGKLTAYYCVSDPLNFDLTTQAPTCDHSGETETRNAKAATCTEAGYTGDTYCAGCGEKLSDGTAIPCTGHSFDEGVCTGCGETAPTRMELYLSAPEEGDEGYILTDNVVTETAGYTCAIGPCQGEDALTEHVLLSGDATLTFKAPGNGTATVWFAQTKPDGGDDMAGHNVALAAGSAAAVDLPIASDNVLTFATAANQTYTLSQAEDDVAPRVFVISWTAPVDATELADAVADKTTEVDTDVVVDTSAAFVLKTQTWTTAQAKTDVQTALQGADAVAKNNGATALEVDEAYMKLGFALAAFEDACKPGAADYVGTLDDTLRWGVADSTLTVSATGAANEKVLAACRDASGRFQGVAILTGEARTATLGGDPAKAKLMWLDSGWDPKCAAAKVAPAAGE